MCMAALHWARVDTVYYGATIADADDGRLQRAATAGRRTAAPRRQQIETDPAAAAGRMQAVVCGVEGESEAKSVLENDEVRMTNVE